MTEKTVNVAPPSFNNWHKLKGELGLPVRDSDLKFFLQLRWNYPVQSGQHKGKGEGYGWEVNIPYQNPIAIADQHIPEKEIRKFAEDNGCEIHNTGGFMGPGLTVCGKTHVKDIGAPVLAKERLRIMEVAKRLMEMLGGEFDRERFDSLLPLFRSGARRFASAEHGDKGMMRPDHVRKRD
jgi:hypothetical protein